MKSLVKTKKLLPESLSPLNIVNVLTVILISTKVSLRIKNVMPVTQSKRTGRSRALIMIQSSTKDINLKENTRM